MVIRIDRKITMISSVLKNFLVINMKSKIYRTSTRDVSKVSIETIFGILEQSANAEPAGLFTNNTIQGFLMSTFWGSFKKHETDVTSVFITRRSGIITQVLF